MGNDSPQEEKSRSQVKREHRALKDLGIQLAGLSKGQLRSVPLSEETRDAVLAAKTMTRTALQRQYRHLSSLLAEEDDVDAIRAALAGELKPHADEIAALHEVEQWRDKLLSADESQLPAFVEQHPSCDPKHLRQLIRNAKRERELEESPKSARQLFRYLRKLSEQQ